MSKHAGALLGFLVFGVAVLAAQIVEAGIGEGTLAGFALR